MHNAKCPHSHEGNEALINAGRMKRTIILLSERYQTQKLYAVQLFTDKSGIDKFTETRSGCQRQWGGHADSTANGNKESFWGDENILRGLES